MEKFKCEMEGEVFDVKGGVKTLTMEVTEVQGSLDREKVERKHENVLLEYKLCK